jgi:hypothetical protein
MMVPFGVAVSALTLLTLGFDKWAWKYGCFKGWLVKRPRREGTWKVVLQSKWIDPATGNQIAPIACYMVIRQTYSSLTLRLFTPESSSVSISASVLTTEDCVYRVAATYQNDPKIELRNVRSEIHYGALILNVNDDPVTSLNGHYWTDRSTSGTLALSERKPTLASSFESAGALFSQTN